MEFLEAMPVTFKEITPNYNLPDKWKEVILNTGGTHSTLQDIKLPQKAGGYWYKDSKKVYTRNRFIYWQTTSDAIELSEASLDINLSSCNLRCKVAAGTPPLSSITVYERSASRDVVILAATVSSVHRLIFPHPATLDKKSTFGSLSSSSPSIFHDISSINNPSNYCILNQYSNATTGVAHTCASLLRDNGEAVFALAFGHGGEGGLLLVKLPVTGSAATTLLKRESTVPRFLSGLTGALRGKSNTDGIETYGVVLTSGLAVAICGDTCLRAWPLDEGGAPIAVSAPLSQTLVRPKPPPHGHMLQRTIGSDGSVLLVAYLSFPNECEFVVMKMHDGGSGGVRFSHISRIFGPQLDLLDYAIGYGDGSNVIWALWSQPDGDTIITSVCVGAEAYWRAVATREAAAALPALGTHQHYRDRLLAPGLFPPAVIRKALVIYNRTWGSNEPVVEGELGEAAAGAVQARLRHLTARTSAPDHAHLMHKCWSELYSWCMQYMESLQKPLGLMVSKQESDVECGWWGAVVRRAGISLICELEPLERMMLSPDVSLLDGNGCVGELSGDAVRVVVAGARWERGAGGAAAELEQRLFAAAAPQHRLLPRLLHLLAAPQDQDTPAPALTPQQIDDLTSILEPIKDLQSAVLELNDALRLDVPEIDATKSEEEDTGEYDGLLASDLGVAIVTEAIRQMAEMRCRVVRGAVCALGAWRGAGGVPGAGHCAVHWQAYRALLWLRAATLAPQAAGPSEAFRLKLSALGAEAGAEGGGAGRAGGAVCAYVRAAGGRRARDHLAKARAPTTWHQALPLLAYHLAHQLWAVSGGFEFSWWLATIDQPRLVQKYVTMLEPWCEWNACSRQFILGLALLDLDDAENAYTAFCKAAKGVSTEPFLRQLVAAPDARLTQHQALVLYYMKVIKLFEIHDAGACVVRLAETAISIADKDDPNLAMFQWVVFKWHLAGGRTARALSAAAASPAPHARHAAAATLLTTLASRRELGALVSCAALAGDAERAAAARAKLHDAHAHNPYYDFLYALHVSRHHYRKAAAVMYERAARCGAERSEGAAAVRRRCLGAALTCLRLAQPDHAFLARPAAAGKHLQCSATSHDIKMPKRRHDETIEHLASKLKKLERKIRRSRKRRSPSLSSTSSSSSGSSSSTSSRSSSPAQPALLALSEQDRNEDRRTAPEPGTSDPAPPSAVPEPIPGTSAGTGYNTSSVPAGPSSEDHVITMPDAGLDPDILDILGIDPSAAVEYGPNINDELASRLSYLVTSGLDKDIRKELLQKYLVPINCKHLSAPQLNPEIKAATPEYVQKRDKSIEMNQKEIAAAITCVGQIITTQINHSCRDNELLKQLMDVGRILCDVQYLQSSARRNHALYSLKKDLREQLRNSKIDEFLFGQNLSETLKAAKAVSKTSSDLKADTAKKPRPSKNLNRKSGPGNRRAAPGPPRQQPPAPARATTSYQPPPPPPTTRAPYSSASSYRPRQTRRR